MEKKKIIILLILFVAVIGLTISTVNAKTYTKTVQFKSSGTTNVDKHLGNGEYLSIFYTSKYSQQHATKNVFTICAYSNEYFPATYYYKVTKAKITYTKKVNGKTKTYTTTYNADKKYGVITKHPPKGWKPYSTVVTYKDI